jgi:hypothetical protein
LKSKNCLTCNDLDKKKIGPAYKGVAANYKDNKEAEAKLIGELKEGKGHPSVTRADHNWARSVAIRSANVLTPCASYFNGV